MVTTRESSQRFRRHRSQFFLHAKLRHGRTLARAFDTIGRGTPIRLAACDASYSVKDMVFSLNQRGCRKRAAHRQLKNEEERQIVRNLRVVFDRNGKLVLQDIMNEVQKYVLCLPVHRRQKISFANGIPSRKFCTEFEERHRDSMFCVHRRNLGRAWRAFNGRDMSIFHAQLHWLKRHYRVCDERVLSIGTVTLTPRSEIERAVVRHGRMSSMWRSSQVCRGKMRVLNAIKGDGTFLRPVVLDDGSTDFYLNLSLNSQQPLSGMNHLEAGSGQLGSSSFHSVNSDWSLHWAAHLVHDVRKETRQGCKFVVLYDPMDVDFTARDLDMLWEGGLIPLAVPENTASQLLPLQPDGLLNRRLKEKLGYHLLNKLQNFVTPMLPMAVLKKCLEEAFESAFSYFTILESFSNCGVGPLDETIMFGRARPVSVDQPHKFANMSELSDQTVELFSKPHHHFFLTRCLNGSYSAATGAQGYPDVCPCQYKQDEEVSDATNCVHKKYGDDSEHYKHCPCGLRHVPHTCTARFLFPNEVLKCRCRRCIDARN